MGLIESSKVYSGQELENIFFRPVFADKSTDDLGFRVLYNMPMPTTIGLWTPQNGILKSYQAGWQGDNGITRKYCPVDMRRVKAETASSASDYFSQVYEYIVNNADVNMQDLSGTVLEEAETAIFKASVAECLRVTAWMGDSEGDGDYDTFDGIIKSVYKYAVEESSSPACKFNDEPSAENAATILDKVWRQAGAPLRALRKDGQLAFFVTSDIYDAYEQYLDAKGADAAYRESTDGRERLCYHGIPVVDMNISHALAGSDFPSSMCILTDRRNLVLAVNTADCPETEVRMWYNPDMMENRQRAVFLAGTAVIDPELVSFGYK